MEQTRVPRRRHIIQTPGNHPKERIQHSERGGSLKTREKTLIENGNSIYKGVNRVCAEKFPYDYSRRCKCEAGLRI
jgi:hypothetical protein